MEKDGELRFGRCEALGQGDEVEAGSPRRMKNDGASEHW